MSREIWVAGFPSRYGGADTELDHTIELWRSYGVKLHLVPMFGVSDEMFHHVVALGCHVHDYAADIFAGRTVVSFCNGEFLAHLPAIVAAGRPARVIWFNCMTWLFDAECEAHANGRIDYFGFVSAYQRRVLGPQLSQIAPWRTFGYRPFFDVRRVEWRYRPWEGTYRIGRISRDDESKFAPDTWRIFERVLVPSTLAKKVYILGYGPNAARRIGPAPEGLDWRTWGPDEIPATQFFNTLDTMIHKTGGSRESYCRVVVEAYAHGVVPIVESGFAFPELVIYGETGYLTDDLDEMSYYASELAMGPREHRRLAENGREHLARLVDRETCWRAWEEVI